MLEYLYLGSHSLVYYEMKGRDRGGV